MEQPATDDSTARPRIGRRAVAAVLGCVAALGVLEVAVRVVDAEPVAVTKRLLVHEDGRHLRYHCYPDNAAGTFQPLPDVTTGTWSYFEILAEPRPLELAEVSDSPWCVEYRYEIPSIRGPRIARFPAPGVTRVAGVGDSFALGEGVPEEGTLFAQLQQLAGERVEVVNIGESGAEFDFYVGRVDWAFAELACARTIVVFIPNDIDLSAQLKARNEAVFDLINVRAAHDSGTAERPWYARVSRLGGLVEESRRMRAITQRTIANYRDAYDPAQNQQGLDALLADFRALAARPGNNVVLVLYPLLFALDDYPLAAAHEKVATMAIEAGLPVLDLAPAFAGEDERTLWVHPIDHHPNARAHGLAAAALLAFLERELPDFLQR